MPRRHPPGLCILTLVHWWGNRVAGCWHAHCELCRPVLAIPILLEPKLIPKIPHPQWSTCNFLSCIKNTQQDRKEGKLTCHESYSRPQNLVYMSDPIRPEKPVALKHLLHWKQQSVYIMYVSVKTPILTYKYSVLLEKSWNDEWAHCLACNLYDQCFRWESCCRRL